MTAPKIFEPEYYAHMRLLEERSWWNAGMRDLAGRLLQHASLPAQGTMLDVGCGSGQTMSWFRSRWTGWGTVGLDLAFVGLQAARQSGGERVFAASAVELPVASASVDVVITLDVLQHLPLGGGDVRALAEIRRVLRPRGVLFIRTNAQVFPYAADDPEHNFHRYTKAELRAKLEAGGFTVHRIGRVNALLGLAEIPRELRARRKAKGGYVGHLATVPRVGMAWHMKHAWIRVENMLVAAGLSLPAGRTMVALAQVREGA